MNKNLTKMKNIIKYCLIFIIIVISVLTLMVGVAKIPKKLIKENVTESAEYLKQKPMYYEIIKNHPETKIDHYADSITLNIVYNLESENSLKSILYAKYYGNNGEEEVTNLMKTVTTDDSKAETQYIRYWHGTIIVLKLLLLVFNIKQIYILNAIVLILLLTVLIYKLLKNKMHVVAIGLIIALIITNSYCVPFALEYVNMYFVAIIGSIILLFLLERKKETAITILFFILGICTCFFDFLTTETITVTIPLIILLIYKYKNNDKIIAKEILKLILKIAAIWLIGYALMWTAKWGIATLYLNENIKDVVIENAVERIEKAQVYEINIGKTLSKSVILRNIYCLFPICNINNQELILGIFIFALFTFLFFARKDKNKILSVIMFLIAVIPYIRYLLINNHSYLHYFFTYRAQITSVLGIILGSYYMINSKKIGEKLKWKMKRK